MTASLPHPPNQDFVLLHLRPKAWAMLLPLKHPCWLQGQLCCCRGRNVADDVDVAPPAPPAPPPAFVVAAVSATVPCEREARPPMAAVAWTLRLPRPPPRPLRQHYCLRLHLPPAVPPLPLRTARPQTLPCTTDTWDSVPSTKERYSWNETCAGTARRGSAPPARTHRGRWNRYCDQSADRISCRGGGARTVLRGESRLPPHCQFRGGSSLFGVAPPPVAVADSHQHYHCHYHTRPPNTASPTYPSTPNYSDLLLPPNHSNPERNIPSWEASPPPPMSTDAIRSPSLRSFVTILHCLRSVPHLQ
mmetsp:Transcript_36965/g.62870  ORF Transcript_36965/g.62870 Transcript_36965/m.62870 type:complete len:304 (+) Transcript_36965:297-1208(+)